MMAPPRASGVSLISSMWMSSRMTILPRPSCRLFRSSSASAPISLGSAFLYGPIIRQQTASLRRQRCRDCGVRKCQPHKSRCFSTSPLAAEPTKEQTSAAQDTKEPGQPESAFTQLGSLSRSLGLSTGPRNGASRRKLEDFTSTYQQRGEHHLYVFAHKHNTHITLAGPQYPDPKTNRMRQDIILTLSCGSIGYRKSQRSTFDAAYQLGSYFMSRIQNDGLLMKIQRLELVLRGFGNGREAVTKLMLGQEGAALRDRVVRVVDASKIKFGGQRAPRPRRLG